MAHEGDVVLIVLLFLGGFLKVFFRKFSSNPHGKYAILMDMVKYEVVHMKI